MFTIKFKWMNFAPTCCVSKMKMYITPTKSLLGSKCILKSKGFVEKEKYQ